MEGMPILIPYNYSIHTSYPLITPKVLPNLIDTLSS